MQKNPAQENNQQDSWTIQGLDFDAKENLIGFYSLLLKVDMRNNPHLYRKLKNRERKGIC